MQPIKFFKYNIILLFLIFSKVAFAQTAYMPEPTGKVISDFQNLLSQDEKEGLAVSIKENYLNNSNQLIVVSIPTKFLGDLTIEDYANQLFKKWKPGQQGLNNGVLFIIAGSRLDSVNRKVRIEVGYGLEGALPDLLTQRILHQLVVPHLKQYDYYTAVQLGTKAILNAIKTENRGHKPIFKLKTNSSILLKDNAGVLSAKDFEMLDKRINSFLGYDLPCEINIINENEFYYQKNESTKNEVDFPTKQFAFQNNPFFDLSISPNVSVDSVGNVIREASNYYKLKIYRTEHLSELTKYDFLQKITTLLNQEKIPDALHEAINMSEKNLLNAWLKAIGIIFLFCIPFFISTFVLWKTKEQRKLPNGELLKYDTKIYNVLATLMLFSALVAVVANIIITIAVFFFNYKIPYIYLIPLFLIAESFLVCGVVFNYRIINYYLPNFFKSSQSNSSNGDGYSSSSSSSYDNSSSSSSDSSDSSSSNDDYGGGGGDSGGGGSSSDW